jgi:hypothetical protein
MECVPSLCNRGAPEAPPQHSVFTERAKDVPCVEPVSALARGSCPEANVPIIVSVDDERNEVRAVAVGPVTFDDVRNHLLLERYFNGLAYRELIDARRAWVALKASEVRKVAELLLSLGQESKLGPTAVLVSDDIAFGVVRTVEMVEDVCKVRPFFDEQEARAWLAAE